MIIKIKPTYILVLILSVVVSTGIVTGVDANVDENSVYMLKELNVRQQRTNILTEEIEDLKNEIQEQKSKIEKYDVDIPKIKTDMDDMKAEIERLSFYNGMADVRGPGVMIRVSDSSNLSEFNIMNSIVHDFDITIILADLKNAGAEAIDVNGKRIINISEVICAGPLVRINGEGVSVPFVIRAIGNQEELYNAVTKEDTYANYIKTEYGIDIVSNISYDLVIPRYYSKNYKIKYAHTTE